MVGRENKSSYLVGIDFFDQPLRIQFPNLCENMARLGGWQELLVDECVFLPSLFSYIHPLPERAAGVLSFVLLLVITEPPWDYR